MKNFRKVLSSVLMFSFLAFNSSPLVALAIEDVNEVLPTSEVVVDENTDPVPGPIVEDEPVIEQEEITEEKITEEKPAEEIVEDPSLNFPSLKGSITVCKVILDAEGNVVAGTSGNFSVPSGNFGNSDFDAPLDFNTNLLTDVSGLDAECVSHDNLAIKFFGNTTFNYEQEVVSPSDAWEAPLYNEYLLGSPHFSLSDVNNQFSIFDQNADNADGTITLSAFVKNRTLVVINKMKPVVVEEELQCNPQVNLVENGGFEVPAIPSNSWNLFPESTPGLEWSINWVDPLASAEYPTLEIQNNVAGSPFAGNQHAELDGDRPVTIWQDIPTIPGKQYSLSFQYSPRPGVSQADNAIQPKVNDGALGAVVSADGSANSNTVWQNITRTFVATGAITKVELMDAGNNTSLGGYLDDVSLNCNPEPIEVVETSTVTMCKVNEQEQPLSGWQLTLGGEDVGSVQVLPDGNDHNILGVPAGDYLLKASGQYIYRPSEPDANYTDAAYSKRLVGDVDYNGPFLPWVRVNDFLSPYEGYLGVIFNNAVTDWGSMFNPSHEYALGTSTGVLGDLSFKILDNNYTDNSGYITVNAKHGYTGVTDEDGCVTFKGVPYGTYTADEIMQDGWENVSGTGEVVVNDPTETFTIVNSQTETEATTLKVHVYKYLNDGETTSQIPNDSAAPSFRMMATWNAVNLSGTSAGYELGDSQGGAALRYAADTSPMNAPADYSTFEITDGDVVVPTDSESCPEGKYRLLGYKTGTSLSEAELATLSQKVPAYENITSDRYIIVVNEKCGDVTPPPSSRFTLQITTNGDGNGLVQGAGIYCDSNPTVGEESEINVNDCQETYDEGTVVNLTVTPDEGSNFNSSWSTNSGSAGTCTGNSTSCSVTLTSNTSLNAHFAVTNNNSVSNGPFGSSSGSRTVRQGQVLGAETSCGIYVDKFLRRGYKNDVNAVMKLQKFLNDYMKAGLKEDGKFGYGTEKWLKSFQLKHADKVLTPWGFKSKAPTGIFYLTTQTEVNNIMCPPLNLPIPLLTPIETNPLAPIKED